MTTLDLTALPPPQVLDEPDFQVIFDALIARHKEADPNYTYYTAGDPVTQLFQVIAYRELVWRNRTNEVALSRLLAYATGTDLDHLGSFCPSGGVTRMIVQEANNNLIPVVPEIKEGDEAYRRRIQLRLSTPSTAGPVEHYLYHALSASPLVKDALAYSPDFDHGFNMGGRVNITVLSREGNGIPSTGLLQVVEQAVNSEEVAVLTDLITVEPARLKPIDIAVSVVLYQDTPVALFNNLEALFRSEFAKMQRLGNPITPSWIMQVVHREGVQNVTLLQPTSVVAVEPYEYPFLQSLNISFGGFYFGAHFDPADLAMNRLYNEVYKFYRLFAIRNRRGILDILADLSYTPKAGVVMPTLVGFATYLGIAGVTPANGAAMPADEIAAAIYFVLSQDYGKVIA